MPNLTILHKMHISACHVKVMRICCNSARKLRLSISTFRRCTFNYLKSRSWGFIANAYRVFRLSQRIRAFLLSKISKHLFRFFRFGANSWTSRAAPGGYNLGTDWQKLIRPSRILSDRDLHREEIATWTSRLHLHHSAASASGLAGEFHAVTFFSGR